MNPFMKTETAAATRTIPPIPLPERRALDRLLAQLDQIAENSDYLLRKPFGQFESSGRSYNLPRYVFLGPTGGGDTVRIGIFATIHGDEPEGALALTRLVSALEKNPELAKGYCLLLYPVCNPTGFEDSTRHSRTGRDLNREFWKSSSQPEVRLLETEIWLHAFDGIITLHTDDTSDGIYGFVAGTVLSENLLEPALREAEKFLPRNRQSLRSTAFPPRTGSFRNLIPEFCALLTRCIGHRLKSLLKHRRKRRCISRSRRFPSRSRPS